MIRESLRAQAIRNTLPSIEYQFTSVRAMPVAIEAAQSDASCTLQNRQQLCGSNLQGSAGIGGIGGSEILPGSGYLVSDNPNLTHELGTIFQPSALCDLNGGAMGDNMLPARAVSSVGYATRVLTRCYCNNLTTFQPSTPACLTACMCDADFVLILVLWQQLSAAAKSQIVRLAGASVERTLQS